MTTKKLFLDGLQTRLSGEAERWLGGALVAARGDRNGLLRAYTEASRTLGRLPFSLSNGSAFPPPEAEGLSLDRWMIEDAARLVLLLERSDAAAGSEFADDAIACYELGNAREQQSWLKAIALLPSPERYLPIVIDACRTNILPQFEAVACENPYPSRYFPERNFNQVVLKALFNGVRLERIVGLPARANAELARMAGDYAAERMAAGRAVPADIDLAMTGAAA
jgi:hypothetical protein